MLIDINIAQRGIVGDILESTGRWQWDDTNQTDLPIATTDITSGQQQYSFADEHLKIERVEVLDENSNWQPLRPFDIEDESNFGRAYSELADESGVPYRYDVQGDSIFLHPVPDYSQSNGLKVFFLRGPVNFTSSELSTGTKEPGFASLFHHIIAYLVSRDYALAHELPNANNLDAIAEREMAKLKDFYSQRHRNERKRITPNLSRSNRVSQRIRFSI